MSGWCVVHNCPEESSSGRCFDWLNDPAIPQLPACRMTERKRATRPVDAPCCPDCGANDLIDLRCPNCYPFGTPIRSKP